jgi:hypothetical protein
MIFANSLSCAGKAGAFQEPNQLKFKTVYLEFEMSIVIRVFSFIFNFRVSNLFLKVVDEVVELGLRWESQAKNHSLTKNWRK